MCDVSSPSTGAAATSPALPTTRGGWLDLLRRLGVRPSKGLGQNFLVERGVCQRLVSAAAIEDDDLVIEIGPGLGILTQELLGHARRVIAVELDARLATHLRHTFAYDDRLEVIEADALDLELDPLVPSGEPITVAASLPYSSATAIIRHLLEQPRRPRCLAVMVQREVAERIAAEPPNMTILGVATRFYTKPRVAFIVPPTVFVPPPKVESAVVVLDVSEEPPLPEALRPWFFHVVNAGFRQRRKQLANTLAAELNLPKAGVIQWLTAAGIAPDRRAQTLSLSEWLTLATNMPDRPVSDLETR